MITTSDFRRGFTKILWNNDPWLVLEFHVNKTAQRSAIMRTKLKNLRTGSIVEEAFPSGEKFPEPDLEYKDMQFLYEDGLYHFMDQDNYDQVELSVSQVASVKKYLKEGAVYRVVNFAGTPILIESPMFMVLEIKETVPGVKGDTAQGGTKAATLESGAVIQVPLFVNEGDKVKVDTRDDKYIERVS